MGVLFKQFDLIGALLCIPLSFLGGLLFSGFGLSTAAWAKTIEKISYPQLLIIFPMFLFCGTYYPLERLPEMAQKISWVLPLTPLCLMLRGLTLNLAYPWYCLPVLVLWTVFFVWLSINRMTKRLIQ
jgi:lipooligosaccharide transport system permease protein